MVHGQDITIPLSRDLSESGDSAHWAAVGVVVPNAVFGRGGGEPNSCQAGVASGSRFGGAGG
jgi:hypothetical protein